MLSKKGVTLIELIAVVVIIGILAAVGVVLIGNLIKNTRLKADQATVEALNIAVSYYDVTNPTTPIGDSGLNEQEIIDLLVSEGFLYKAPILQSNDSVLTFDLVNDIFQLSIDNVIIPLSPYGNTFDEIAPQIISDIQDKYANTGSYGRTWGDYKYTDIGLDPDDWDEPILHIIYKPSGSVLRLEPEDGYTFVVEKISGQIVAISSASNWDILYNDLDGKWYYHSIDPAKEIDITTLVVSLS